MGYYNWKKYNEQKEIGDINSSHKMEYINHYFMHIYGQDMEKGKKIHSTIFV